MAPLVRMAATVPMASMEWEAPDTQIPPMTPLRLWGLLARVQTIDSMPMEVFVRAVRKTSAEAMAAATAALQRAGVSNLEPMVSQGRPQQAEVQRELEEMRAMMVRLGK